MPKIPRHDPLSGVNKCGQCLDALSSSIRDSVKFAPEAALANVGTEDESSARLSFSNFLVTIAVGAGISSRAMLSRIACDASNGDGLSGKDSHYGQSHKKSNKVHLEGRMEEEYEVHSGGKCYQMCSQDCELFLFIQKLTRR